MRGVYVFLLGRKVGKGTRGKDITTHPLFHTWLSSPLAGGAQLHPPFISAGTLIVFKQAMH